MNDCQKRKLKALLFYAACGGVIFLLTKMTSKVKYVLMGVLGIGVVYISSFSWERSGMFEHFISIDCNDMNRPQTAEKPIGQ